MKVSIDVCDHCGDRTDNACSQAGWIHLHGNLARYRGIRETTWTSDFLTGQLDFCSIDCLVAALDARRAASERSTTTPAPAPMPLGVAPGQTPEVLLP
jgi:hypothetical protein